MILEEEQQLELSRIAPSRSLHDIIKPLTTPEKAPEQKKDDADSHDRHPHEGSTQTPDRLLQQAIIGMGI